MFSFLNVIIIIQMKWVYYFITYIFRGYITLFLQVILLFILLFFYTYNIVLSIYLSLLIIEKVWQLNGSASRSSRYEVKKEENRRWDSERAPTMAPLGHVGFLVLDSFR